MQAPKHVLCEWGVIVVVQASGTVTLLKEKGLTSKLELLFNKNMFPVALNLATDEQVSDDDDIMTVVS